MKNLNSILILCTIFFLQGCVSNTALQTGRSIGKGNSEIILGGSFYANAPKADYENEDYEYIGNNIGLQALGIWRHGFGEKFDAEIGTVLSVKSFELTAKCKYQFLGDQHSLFAASAGFGVGTNLYFGNAIEIPLYVSYHPWDDFAVYVSPRYKKFSKGYGFLEDFEAMSVVTGIEFGEKHTFYLEYGFTPYKQSTYSIRPTRQIMHHLTMVYSFNY